MAPRAIKAVVFDLYGTLLRIRRRQLHKAVPQILEIDKAQWVELIRGELLTRAFPDAAAFVHFVCERLGRSPEAEGRLLAVVEAELASVELVPGVLALLAFLRRRGYRLGVLSNASSVHKEPFQRLGLEALVDAASFSCDAGACKPEKHLYLELCGRLAAAPDETLMVGDSLPNDVVAPRALGMRALRVGGDGPGVLPSAAHLGFVSLEASGEPEPLLADGARLTLGGRAGVLRELQPLADTDQGRYNLVASARFESDAGGVERVYCKRYLHPDGAQLEDFAYGLLVALGMPSCHATVTPGPEPCLVVSEAPGEKLDGAIPEAAFAREVGRQAALAYLFANADLRPRNGFVARGAGAPTITMTDLEHCFLNLALDVTGLEDPLRPQALDALSEAELEARIARRVLTPRTMLRARRAFLGSDVLASDLEAAFKAGWMATYQEVQRQSGRASELIERRLQHEPFLIVGTQAYRRAMARVDLDDIRRRLGEDAETVYALSFVRSK